MRPVRRRQGVAVKTMAALRTRPGRNARAVIPLPVPVAVQPDPRLMHQRGRLEPVLWTLARHALRGYAPEFFIHQREQFLRRAWQSRRGGSGIAGLRIHERQCGNGAGDVEPMFRSLSRRRGVMGREGLHRCLQLCGVGFEVH